MALACAIKLLQTIMAYSFSINLKNQLSYKMKENKSRSVGKSISWRILASCDTILISYIITGSFTIAATIGSIEVLTKMFLYYFHERAWNKFAFGRG
jgi:uncharacterized membrane protein